MDPGHLEVFISMDMAREDGAHIPIPEDRLPLFPDIPESSRVIWIGTVGRMVKGDIGPGPASPRISGDETILFCRLQGGKRVAIEYDHSDITAGYDIPGRSPEDLLDDTRIAFVVAGNSIKGDMVEHRSGGGKKAVPFGAVRRVVDKVAGMDHETDIRLGCNLVGHKGMMRRLVPPRELLPGVSVDHETDRPLFRKGPE
jgi:hypothetical protein